MMLLSFCILLPLSPSFPLSLSLHQIREEYFLLMSFPERKTDYIGAFVEFALAISKMEFDAFFSMPSTCSPHSPSVGLGPN